MGCTTKQTYEGGSQSPCACSELKVKPKRKVSQQKIWCMAAVLFLEMAQASQQSGTCAAWRSCSRGLGVSRHTARDTKVPSKIKALVMAEIWFEWVSCHIPVFHSLKNKLFCIKIIPFISKNNCFQKPEKNVRLGKQEHFFYFSCILTNK